MKKSVIPVLLCLALCAFAEEDQAFHNMVIISGLNREFMPALPTAVNDITDAISGKTAEWGGNFEYAIDAFGFGMGFSFSSVPAVSGQAVVQATLSPSIYLHMMASRSFIDPYLGAKWLIGVRAIDTEGDLAREERDRYRSTWFAAGLYAGLGLNLSGVRLGASLGYQPLGGYTRLGDIVGKGPWENPFVLELTCGYVLQFDATKRDIERERAASLKRIDEMRQEELARRIEEKLLRDFLASEGGTPSERARKALREEAGQLAEQMGDEARLRASAIADDAVRLAGEAMDLAQESGESVAAIVERLLRETQIE